MSDSAPSRLSTPLRLLLFMTLALLPFGLLLVASTSKSLREADGAATRSANQRAQLAAEDIESLIARNALALRIAANAALRDGAGATDCDEATRSLAISPGLARTFEIEDVDGKPVCSLGNFDDLDRPPLTAPGAIRLWVAVDGKSILVRTGVMGGSATTRLTREEIDRSLAAAGDTPGWLSVRDDRLALKLGTGQPDRTTRLVHSEFPIANGDLVLVADTPAPQVALAQALVIALPLIMLIVAGLASWFLVHRFLTDPLRRLQRAVGQFTPSPGEQFLLPEGLGSAIEIRELGAAFARSIDRIEQSESAMSQALDVQRQLVREVHHRVKNNLQVVASMLSIHSRSADGPAAKAAYAAIARRVGALSVVHRNHFAEGEENRGIALRPMLTELAGELRASVPESARPFALEIDVEPMSTTQDIAVATAFLVTEIVEYAMLCGGAGEPVDVELRRTGDLTAQLSVAAHALVKVGETEDPGRHQFERVASALARQLRSPLDSRLGRMSVDLPVFPTFG